MIFNPYLNTHTHTISNIHWIYIRFQCHSDSLNHISYGSFCMRHGLNSYPKTQKMLNVCQTLCDCDSCVWLQMRLLWSLLWKAKNIIRPPSLREFVWHLGLPSMEGFQSARLWMGFTFNLLLTVKISEVPKILSSRKKAGAYQWRAFSRILMHP